MTTDAAFQRKKEQYRTDGFHARHTASHRMQAATGLKFSLNTWNNTAADAYQKQWLSLPRLCAFDWPAIFQANRQIHRFDVVIWGPGDRLSGVGMATERNQAIYAAYFEGDPSPNCALRPYRMAIYLDAVTEYAEMLGKSQVHCVPINPSSVAAVLQKAGFRLETPRKGSPYYVLEL